MYQQCFTLTSVTLTTKTTAATQVTWHVIVDWAWFYVCANTI